MFTGGGERGGTPLPDKKILGNFTPLPRATKNAFREGGPSPLQLIFYGKN